MDPFIMFSLLIGILLLVLLTGMPVGYSMALVAIAGIYIMSRDADPLLSAAIVPNRALNDFVLVAVPLFVMAGSLITASGIGSGLFDLASKWLSWLPNGLPVSAVGACTLFAAISGSSVAAVATMGMTAVPVLIERGYKKELATGVICCAGTLAILIPPSLVMVFYGAMTQTSVGHLFMAGLIPGLVIAFLIIAYLVIVGLIDRARGRDLAVRRESAVTWRERFVSVRQNIWGLTVPVIILGGIYSGVFTPTEAAAVLLLYAILVGLVFLRTLNWNKLKSSLLTGMALWGMMVLIYFGGVLMGQLASFSGFSGRLAEWVQGLTIPPIAVILVINLILLILGCFMDVFAMFLLTLPIFFPVVMALGYDPYWFAVQMVINIEIGQVTPPVGIVLFIISGLSKVDLAVVMRGAFPFTLLLLLGMLLVIFIPWLATWLPSTM